jgi:N6-L-threonylcarbamoyladenine synthase
MLCLGIESTAHTFAASLVDEKEIISDERSSHTTEEGGMIPRELAEHHTKVYADIMKKAVVEKPDLVAFAQGPGIGHALRIGAVAARALSSKYTVPLIGVNHCVAHLEIARRFTGFEDPIMLYVSGGNTQVIGFESGRYRVFGETLDIGVGNLLDTFGREAGIGFPAGPEIEKLARGGKYIELPYSVKGMDVSFTGMLTKVKTLLGKHSLKDICFSLQEASFAMLVEVGERAIAHTGKGELVLTGGVGANSRLQEMCKIMCEERDAVFKAIPKKYAVDNAAMIAHTGLVMHRSGCETKNSAVKQRWRTDEVEVLWR